jgi:ubiquinone/menaquinone biosynthesis C-methylase UbiE
MEMSLVAEETRAQAAVFDQIGAQYQTAFGVNPTQVAATRWLIQQLPVGARVLDVGCGTGVPTAQVLAEAGLAVVGIDRSPVMLRLAQANVPRGSFALMDMTAPALPADTFAAMTAFFSLLMLRKAVIGPTLRQLTRALCPQSPVVVAMVAGEVDYAAIPFLGQTVHVSAYAPEAFVAVLGAAGLRVEEQQSVEFRAAEAAPAETQVFYYCRYAPPVG